jgi:hypothetical protein
MRPDYCPVGNEPCQSLCDEPCSTTPKRKPLTDEEIDKLLGPLPRYADEWSMTDFIRFARAIEAAHGITGEKK